MSLEAMWTVQFFSDAGVQFNAGAGVIVFETGRLYGGDSYMYYIGEYKVENGEIIGLVHVDTHSSGGTSIIGNIRQFDVKFRGRVGDSQMQLEGQVDAPVRAKIRVALKKIRELP
jgi:hypothetical protein